MFPGSSMISLGTHFLVLFLFVCFSQLILFGSGSSMELSPELVDSGANSGQNWRTGWWGPIPSFLSPSAFVRSVTFLHEQSACSIPSHWEPATQPSHFFHLLYFFSNLLFSALLFVIYFLVMALAGFGSFCTSFLGLLM